MDSTISYKKRRQYKYTLFSDYQHCTSIYPSYWSGLNGVLTIKKNYAWDGASGPILDTQE